MCSVLKAALLSTIIGATALTSAAQAEEEVPSNTFQGPAYVEKMLIGFCRSAMTDNVGQLIRGIRESRLNSRKVVEGVVCNGDDITDFAARYQASRTYHWLNTRLPVAKRRTDIIIRDIAKKGSDDNDNIVVALSN